MKLERNRKAPVKKREVFAKKSFGQNFLVDQNYINKIISALNPLENDTIIEIGAGRGALTKSLIESGAAVIAVELERDMLAVLRNEFGKHDNFRLIESDALRVDFRMLSVNDFDKLKLVANLPYYISTAILQKLIEQREIFSEMILMFQREVVERITAEAGNKERGFLSVLAQTYLDIEKLFDVPPNAFQPAPKVWSSIMRLRPKKESGIRDESLFRELISASFAQKRKTLMNNLKNAPDILLENIEEKGGSRQMLEDCSIDPQRRAESLTLDEWKILSDAAARQR